MFHLWRVESTTFRTTLTPWRVEDAKFRLVTLLIRKKSFGKGHEWGLLFWIPRSIVKWCRRPKEDCEIIMCSVILAPQLALFPLNS